MAKGSIALAPSKEEKLAVSVFSNLASKKGKKNVKKNNNEQDGSIDFGIVKKFSLLKLSVPMKAEDFEKTIVELDQLRDALTFWGKIIQRQSKIKFIRSAKIINSEESYIEEAAKEEKYIEE